MELILVRHARPVHRRTTDGTPANPGLDPEGHRQAGLLAEWLAAERVDAVVSSPASRAVQTAEPLVARLGAELRLVDGLREFDTEATEYVPVEQLRVADDPRWHALARGELYDCPDPAGFRDRVVAAAEELIGGHPGKRVVAFSHAGVINVYAGHVLGLARDIWFAPDYTSITRVAGSRNGRRGLRSLNETPHLHPARRAGSALGRS